MILSATLLAALITTVALFVYQKYGDTPSDAFWGHSAVALMVLMFAYGIAWNFLETSIAENEAKMVLVRP